ncbi:MULTISPECIES: TraR/DksA family transcriptional regulator [Yersinia pseudotuberculosis complex]|uniref:TraR/DksA family transcriptional regulator n=1 Tax=Yersinia pseudotuberculosis complex TaxID=1649845 RepID=UPI00061B918A|nr:TraR/DksA family transcriptional regulator [Yersinia similis]CNC49625.1 DnaK suppressor protein [Yersinia similis]
MMPDIIDDAQKVIDLMLKHQIKSVRSQLDAVSALFCQECDESIPEERRLAISGVSHCVECQEILEFYRKTGAGIRGINNV